MELAIAEAREALSAGEFPVGCVIIKDQKVVSSGRRDHSREKNNEIDHAEIIALRKLVEHNPGQDLSSIFIYSTMEPCLMCFSTLIVNGIRNIVYSYEDVMGGGAGLELSTLKPLYSSMDVSVVSGVLRDKSLEIFQSFFKRPDNNYLKDSLLALYTLGQKVTG